MSSNGVYAAQYCVGLAFFCGLRMWNMEYAPLEKPRPPCLACIYTVRTEVFMNNIQARIKARGEIKDALRVAGLLDGISITAAQLQNETRPCFWRGVVRDAVARAKDIYVTWHIPSSSAAERADDKTFLREIMIAVDVFSKRSFESEANHKMLERLEATFDTAGFEVEFSDEMFENDTQLFHYPLTLYKLYGGIKNE